MQESGQITCKTAILVHDLQNFLLSWSKICSKILQDFITWEEQHPVLLPKRSQNYDHNSVRAHSFHARLANYIVHLTISSFPYIRWNVTSKCVTCRKVVAKHNPQFHGQFPAGQVNPGSVFDRLGIDYAGSVMVKCGPVKNPNSPRDI